MKRKTVILLLILIGICTISHASANDNLNETISEAQSIDDEIAINEEVTEDNQIASNNSYRDIQHQIDNATEGGTIYINGSYDCDYIIHVNKTVEIVGINNRDLRTLKIDLSNARELSTLFDKDVRVVSESGINKHSDLTSLKPISNFLIGSALTGDSDVEFKAKSMLYGLNKVCGLTTKEAVESCAKNNVSIGGLIFAKKSPRYVTLDKAKEITADYKGDLKFAGVFVDEELEVVPFFFILLAVFLEDAVEAVGHFLGDVGGNLLHVGIALQIAAADVERDVGRVDDAMEQCEELGHDAVDLVGDEDLVAVELYLTFLQVDV